MELSNADIANAVAEASGTEVRISVSYTHLESVEKYLALFEEITNDVEGVRLCKEKLQGYLAPEAADSLEMIITRCV